MWHAYRAGRIRWVDVRTWFACLEMAERRRIAGLQNAAVRCKFTLAELEALTNAGRVRQSINRLQRAGLLQWSTTSIELVESPDALPGEVSGVWAMLGKIQNSRRRVPIPRRVVRTIAGGDWTACQVATALGHLLRCVYRRAGCLTADGSCSAAWVADAFDVTARSVKAARRDLFESGWLTPLPSEHWHRQRYGGRVAVNLAWNPLEDPGLSWSRVEAPGTGVTKGAQIIPDSITGTGSSPPTGPSGAGFSPPDHTPNPLPGSENQEPAADTGVFNAKAPRIQKIRLSDMTDTGRALDLLADAVHRGYIGDTEADRLKFLAGIAWALRIGNDPPRIFAWLVRARAWDRITLADEDRGQAMLREAFGVERGRTYNPYPIFNRSMLDMRATIGYA